MKGYFYNFGRSLLVFWCNSCGWCPSCMKWSQTDAVSCFILMESDHLGEYSPENECSWWWLTFWQPIWKSASESSVPGGGLQSQLTQKTISAQVVKTSVTTNNSPSQDSAHFINQNFPQGMSPWIQTFLSSYFNGILFLSVLLYSSSW